MQYISKQTYSPNFEPINNTHAHTHTQCEERMEGKIKTKPCALTTQHINKAYHGVFMRCTKQNHTFGFCSWYFLHFLGTWDEKNPELTISISTHRSNGDQWNAMKLTESNWYCICRGQLRKTMMNLHRTEILMRIINGLFRRLTNSTDDVDTKDFFAAPRNRTGLSSEFENPFVFFFFSHWKGAVCKVRQGIY